MDLGLTLDIYLFCVWVAWLDLAMFDALSDCISKIWLGVHGVGASLLSESFVCSTCNKSCERNINLEQVRCVLYSTVFARSTIFRSTMGLCWKV